MSDDPRAAVEADVRRVAHRLSGAPVVKVEAAADATRAALQLLADTAQGTDERTAPAPPAWRTVPALHHGALGDQLTVLGAEVLTTIRDVPDDEAIWTRDGRQPLVTCVARVAADLRAIRLTI